MKFSKQVLNYFDKLDKEKVNPKDELINALLYAYNETVSWNVVDDWVRGSFDHCTPIKREIKDILYKFEKKDSIETREFIKYFRRKDVTQQLEKIGKVLFTIAREKPGKGN